MSGDSGFKMDFSDFDKTFKHLVEKAIPEHAEKGLLGAGKLLLDDSDNEAPQTPFLTSALRGSGVVQKGGPLMVQVVYNSEYATRQHEAEPGEFNYTKTHVTHPGPKFMESKMARHKDDYMRVVADEIERA